MRFLHVYAQEKNGISGLARKNFMKAEWSYGEKKKKKKQQLMLKKELIF